jgi:SNF2 family DNA or RNA helicase
MVQLRVRENKLYAFVPFQLKDVCKGVQGARWSKKYKAWTYPKSTETAEQLLSAFQKAQEIHYSEKGEPLPLDLSDKFRGLVEENKKRKENAVFKKRDDLENIPNLKLTAWNHQRQAFWFMKDIRGGGLFMDMGTGKTMVSISLIINRGHNKTFVVCPKSVIDTWTEEMRKFAPDNQKIRIVPLKQQGTQKKADALKKEAEKAEALGEKLLVVCNYESAWRKPLDKILIDMKFDCVIADEVHRIKAPGGKASMYLSRLGDSANYRLGLSGTPMPHSPLDVYGIYRFLDKGVFGTSFQAFKSRYAVMGGYGGHEVQGFQNEDELHERVYSIAYRVTKDVLDLPPQQFITRTGELPKKAQKIYNEIEDHFYSEVDDGEVTVTNALSKLLRLQQITSGYLPMDAGEEEKRQAPILKEIDNTKQEMLKEIMEDLPKEEPVVVFARFTQDLENIKAIAEKAGRTCAELSGKANQLAEWRAGKFNVIAVQIQAGGAGINLTRSRYNVYYSLGFSLEQYEQSLSRTHRPGQKHETIYYTLSLKNTIDEKVIEALAKRKAVVESILNERSGEAITNE